jgi:pimeloyl-ACP methyl ester carboxylesterase
MPKGLRVAMLLMVALAGATLLSAVAGDDKLDCTGPGGDYQISRTTPCSNYFLTPEAEAQAKWEWLGKDPERGRRFIDQELAAPRDPDEFGPLYGLPAWACAHGYTAVNICNGGYWELGEDVGYGYRIMTWIEPDNPIAGRVWHLTNTVAEESILLDRAAQTIAGEIDYSLYAVCGMNIDSATYRGGAPKGFEEGFTPQLAPRAEGALASVIEFCRGYREAFRQALETLIAGGTIAKPETPREEPLDETSTLVVRATADGYLASTVELGLAPTGFRRMVVTGTVVDDEGKPVAGADVRAAPGGSFTIAGTDGAFRLEIPGTGKNAQTKRVALRLVRPRIEVHGDETPDGDRELLGVAADGVSSLVLYVKAVGVRPETVQVAPPALGELVAQSPLGFLLVLGADGRGRLEYHPPTAVDTERLERSLAVHRYAGASTVWGAVVPLEFAYEDVEGNERRSSAEILVVRPPAMLVHGFLGNTETWARLADHLRTRKFDAVINEYFAIGGRDDSIPAQAALLTEFAEGQIRDYARSGILLGRVDVIAHSMGGLVARYAAAELGCPLRKILMVGTPNHGVPYLGAAVGDLGSAWFQQHSGAADQLQAGSEFLMRLNEGEAEGRHLVEGVQYANLIGLRPALSPLSGSSTVPSDVVVDAASSHLNGVREWTFPKLVHSTALSSLAPSITESSDVWSRLLVLLSEDVSPSPFDSARIELQQAAGRVEAARDVGGRSWRRVVGAERLDVGAPIRTGRDGRAVIGLYLGATLWATVQLTEETEVSVLYASPQRVHVFVASGTARLSTHSETGHFEAILGAEGRGRWYEVRPRAIVRSQGTDIVAAVGKVVAIDVIDGGVSLETSSASLGTWTMAAGQRLQVGQAGEVRSVEATAAPLWHEAGAAAEARAFSWWSIVLWTLLGAAALVLCAAALGL